MKTSNIALRYASIALVILLGTTVSCHHHHSHDHEHHHDHDDLGKQITLYCDNYELYAECAPAVVGEQMSVLSHLTRLADFKPINDTILHLTLKQQGVADQSAVSTPSQDGIYKLSLTPQKTGSASLLWQLADGSVLRYDSLVVYESLEAFRANSTTRPTPANSVTFSKEQSWTTDFATEIVTPSTFGEIIKTTAQVISSQGDEQVATSKSSGIVKFAGSDIVEGAPVTKGQRLFVIESSGMADGNMSVRYQEAEADYTLAKSEYERKKSLAEAKVASQSELEHSRAAYERAKAVYYNLKGNFSPRGSAVTAPVSGFVKSINVHNGGFVEAGQPVVTISQNKDLYLRAELSPRYYNSLKTIKTANIELQDGTRSLDELNGALVSYGKATDASNPMIPVTFRISNTINLISGNFISIYIVCDNGNNVISLPSGGIVEEMGNRFVFVQVTPELFEKRMVTTGATDGRRTVITSGLHAGERVVSKGAVMVKLAQSSSALDPHAGHVH